MVDIKPSDNTTNTQLGENTQDTTKMSPIVANNMNTVNNTNNGGIKPYISGHLPGNSPIDVSRKPVQSYTKIQPAIAIKPKPTPIAVMPKPLNLNPRKSTLNPNFKLSGNDTETTLNINTSKKWVLPPRPRPGRKPTSIIVDDERSVDVPIPQTSNISLDKSSPKKKMKTNCSTKRDYQYENNNMKLQYSQSQESSAVIGSHLDEISKKNSSIPTGPKPEINKLNSNVNVIKEDSKEVIDLKLAYLSQLKEQELIRNYIEVLSNQIKELKFVQNGVITFDALNSENVNQKPVKQNPSLKKPPTNEQLENINNINDLNKFVSYLTKSSNIIHSVTKKFLGKENSLAVENTNNINSQIKSYLDIRSKYKISKMEEVKRLNKSRQEIKGNIKNNIGLMNTTSNDATLKKNAAAEPGFISLTNISTGLPSSFTPVLLQNINSTSVFESDDDLIDILNHELTQHDEIMIPEINAFDKLILHEENTVPEMDILNNEAANEVTKESSSLQLSILNNSANPKNNSKANCGFCSNNTPCLCLDADLEINNLMNS